MNLDQSSIPVVFFVVWALLGIGGYLVFERNYVSLAWKRRAWPAYVLLMGVIFLTFGYALKRHDIAFGAVAVLFIAWLNIKRVRFCPQCGSLNRLRGSVRFCRKCGTSLGGPVPKPKSN
jgi:hypothetical protein